MYNMWHNWAAVLEVASELIKQMIHLQLVKSPSLGQVCLQLAACTMVDPQGWSKGLSSPGLTAPAPSASSQPLASNVLCVRELSKTLQPSSGLPDATVGWWMGMEKARTCVVLQNQFSLLPNSS